MNRRSNGIVIETASQRKAPRIEGKAWAGITNPYTRYAELQGEEDGLFATFTSRISTGASNS